MLNVVVDAVDGSPAQVSDAVAWREQFSLEWEVLADADEEWVQVWGDRGSSTFSQHSYTVIGRDGRVVWHDFGEDRNVVDGIDEAIASIE